MTAANARNGRFEYTNTQALLPDKSAMALHHGLAGFQNPQYCANSNCRIRVRGMTHNGPQSRVCIHEI